MRPSVYNTGTPSQNWHDFDFDGLSLSWIDHHHNHRTVDLQDLVDTFKEKAPWCNSTKLDTGEKIEKVFECRGIPDCIDKLESFVYAAYDYLSIMFCFKTIETSHKIQFFHNGEGKVLY